MSPEKDDRARAATGLSFTGTVLAMIFLVATVTQLPAGFVPERISAYRETFRLLWPQGMQLFTNAAGREFTVAYHHDESSGTFVPITRTTGDRDYLWGLDRRAYADLVRLLATVDEIPAAQWHDCAAPSVSDCTAIISSANRQALTSRFAEDVPCGPTVFTKERPSAEGTTRHVVQVAVAELTCAAR